MTLVKINSFEGFIASLSSDETEKTFHKNIFLLWFHHMFSLNKHFIMYLLNNKNYLHKKLFEERNRWRNTS